MPRKGRGGAREGSAQTAYSNRTDLNNRGPEPITTAPGQTYGEATLQRQGQQAVPMAGVQVPAAPRPEAAPASAASGLPAAPSMTPDAPTTPGQGPLDLFAPAEHHDIPTDFNGLNPAVSDPGNGMRNVATLLDGAASSPYATRQVQELAALARMMV